MTLARPAVRPFPFIRTAIFLGWLLFTLMVIAISWGGALLRGQTASFGTTFIWNLGWMLWAGGTFIVAHVTRRFPLDRATLVRGILAHAGLGAALSISFLVLEFLCAHALKALWLEAPPPNAFLGFIVYKFHVYFLIYWMLLGATRAHDFYMRFRETELLASQLQTRLAEAQLLALKHQLQPHFLFNTHHAIISLMLRQETPAAIRMLTRLSDLLRLTLQQPERQLTSLREEIDALHLYLGIQHERYGSRLTSTVDVDPATLDAQVPWLLLQPLVENSLKHGIDTLTDRGELHLEIRRDADTLVIRLRDNGPGFPPGFALRPNAPGIGLPNTLARLTRLYGDRFALTFAGSELRLTLPFIPAPPDS